MEWRSDEEIAVLKAEAERRARDGERFVAIAAALEVPSSTLANWAREGGWRRKDIGCERNEERGKAARARIAELAAREEEAFRERTERMNQLAAAAKAALREADPLDEAKPSSLVSMSTHQLSLSMAKTLLEQGRLEEAERAARLAMRFAEAESATNESASAQWRDDRNRILSWWQRMRDLVLKLQKQVRETADEVRSKTEFDKVMLDMDCCPTCCRPMDFWPVDMQEQMERNREKLEMADE